METLFTKVRSAVSATVVFAAAGIMATLGFAVLGMLMLFAFFAMGVALIAAPFVGQAAEQDTVDADVVA